jgi:YebC/PmpR family DNA-binding regulatory protein
MGRAFEFRKSRKIKRWSSMAKTFTKIVKEITICAKEGGIDPKVNSKLRALIQNAKSANMPKENIERALKKACELGGVGLKNILYEGYAPHGIALLIEATTDNNNRTVANIRSYFNKLGGSLGVSGSVEYMFERKCSFKFKSKDLNLEELELELIDYGIDELFTVNEDAFIYGPFDNFGSIQQKLEEKFINILSSEFERIPINLLQLDEINRKEVTKLINLIEEDSDVMNVFSNLK